VVDLVGLGTGEVDEGDLLVFVGVGDVTHLPIRHDERSAVADKYLTIQDLPESPGIAVPQSLPSSHPSRRHYRKCWVGYSWM
jgi:hypothetical protein